MKKPLVSVQLIGGVRLAALAFLIAGCAMAADAPATQPAPPPPTDVALAASKAYTKVLAAWADLQQTNRALTDQQKALDDARKVLRDIQESARVAQKLPPDCIFSADIQWVKQPGNAPQTPCMVPAEKAEKK